MRHARLKRMPAHKLSPRAVVLEARGFRQRLLGLAWLRHHDLPEGHALLIPRCSSVHTFGMRFPVDIAFADSDGTVLRVIRGVPPQRVRRCPNAALALETHADELGRFLEGGRGAGSRLAVPLPA
jgi:uncharacterized membrane protein (UPF0127 family)